MDTIAKDITTNEKWLQLIDQNLDEIKAGSSAPINKMRGEALDAFRKAGIPGKKSELYKYTHLEPLLRDNLKKYIKPRYINIDVADIFHCDVPDLNTRVIILINGWYYNQQEKLETTENGVIFGSLAEASLKHPELFEKYYGKYALAGKDPLVDFNTAIAQDGLFLYIPDGVNVEKPIQIINISISEEDLAINQRNLIIAGDRSQANIVICDHSLSAHKYFTNNVTEVYVGENAQIDFSRIQNEHNLSSQIASSFVHQEKNSHMVNTTITLHGGLVRNNFYVDLKGAGAENNTLGLNLTDKTQHVDNYTFIRHSVPNCRSNQSFRGILDDMATNAFNGRIFVAPDAQKTEAFQSNKNILLTDYAKAYTRPQLEIYADDVKCSHGATVGQLDDNAMFYLQSRGINSKEAKLLLMYAFAHDIIKQIRIKPLRERIDDLIDKRLRGELSRCNQCTVHCG